MKPGARTSSCAWTYDEPTDMWLAPDKRTAIQGAIVRRIAADLLRARGVGWYSASSEQQAEAIRSALLGEWQQPDGCKSA